jgi:hypothetical protein
MVQVNEGEVQEQVVETTPQAHTGTAVDNCKRKIKFFEDSSMDPLE